MDAVFLKLVELSITGSLFVFAVILLRLIFRKAPKWVFCLLWGLVALRLMVPVSIESSFSLIPENFSQQQIESKMEQRYVGDVNIIYQDEQNYQAAVDAGRRPVQSGDMTYVVTQKDSLEAPETVKTAVLPVLSRIWVVGLALMLGYTLASYLSLRRKVSTATLLKRNIKQSECVDSPFVLGLLRPVIYLPYGIDDADRENVIAHELAHIQRKDHWWKPIGFLILSIYWFNPVMWLAYILLCRDIEGACDEKVIKDMDKEGIRAYSTALLNCSVHRRSIAACPLAFGEVGVKERIKRVMHYKKPAFWIVLLALIASTVVSVLLLTNPTRDEQLLMGAYYQASELLYTNKQEQTQVFSEFCVTADYRLLARKQNSNVWNLNEKMEKYPLTDEELKSLCDYDNGWHRAYRITEIEDAYILRVENNYFYLAAQTRSGDTLLGFGGPDRNGDPGNSSLRYLYRLESEFEPGEMDLDFLAQSLLSEAGIVNIIEVWDSEENPGFLVAGLVSGYQYSAADDYDDMGYAVFQTNGTGYRLLECRMYEDVLYKENRIFLCPDPVVLSLDGEMKENLTFDLILSCNEKLDKVQREYYEGNTRIKSVASMQMGSTSMHMFRWDLAPEADTVIQMILDKDGNELSFQTLKETILEMVNRIASNPSMAASSNPYDYIRDKQELFDEILSYGDTAVNYMVDYLRTSMEDGLKEYIMAAACAEITGIGKDKAIAHWFTGKHWLDLYEGDYRPIVVGRPEDESGSIQVDSLLGIDCVWAKIVEVEDHPYKQGVHRRSYHFYYFGDGKKYDSGQQEQYLLWIENCLEYRMGDFDSDGIVELFVYTDVLDLPYELYDLDGEEIVVEKYALVPDVVLNYEMLLDAEEYYLYEERWAWFLKDPTTYVAEVAKRSEDRLHFICPSGMIPAYTDAALISNAITELQRMFSDGVTAHEKEIILKMLTTIELSYTQKVSPGDVNYQLLFEKWSYPYEGSTEERNCYEQMSNLLDADPVVFLKGMAAVKTSMLKKELRQVAAWLAKENFLYDAAAFERVLNRMEQGADTDREKDIVQMFQDEFEALEVPSMSASAMLSGESTALWDALSFDPEQALNNLSKAKAEERKYLGQALWGAEEPNSKLLDKCYAEVERLLDQNPTGALKDVIYEVLLQLEWYGGYEEYVVGKPFDYQRLFDKWTYSDGALATNCYSQMFAVFNADPEAFMNALVQWNPTAPEGRNMETIALNFAYQYRGNNGYKQILNELLEISSVSECARIFIRQSEKVENE